MTIKTIIGWSMMLLGLVALTGAVADSKIGGWLLNPGPSAVSASMAEIDRVSVRADTGLIRVATAARSDLGVTLNGGNPGAVKVDLVRQGSELQVRISSPWWHSPRFSEPTSVEIWLPETSPLTALDIGVRTGKVEVRQVKADLLTFDGKTGAFTADSVQAKEADLRLITGKFELAHHEGAVQAHVTTGMVQAQFDALTGPVAVDQVTGQVIIDLPDAAGFTLDARVGRGVVTNELPLAPHGAGTHAVNLQVGTGTITVR